MTVLIAFRTCESCGSAELVRAEALRCPGCNAPYGKGADVVCQHGVAMDVHCCGCHAGFLFDATSCVCLKDAR